VVNLSATLPAGVTNVSITADRGTCSTTTCTVPVLRVGEVVNAVVRYTTPSAALYVPVTASVAAHESDPVDSDNTAQASATTGEPGDLGIAIVPSTTSVTQGGRVIYTVTVTNRGATFSDQGTFEFRPGAGFTLTGLASGCNSIDGGATCRVTGLGPGTAQIFELTASVDNAGMAEATASVSIGPDMADINLADNTATASVTALAVSPPGNAGGRRGGGGSFNFATLLGALIVFLLRRRSTRA
jgi:hypothetical protein